MQCSTRGKNTQDHVCTHTELFSSLTLASQITSTHKDYYYVAEDVLSQLQDCFEHTEWDVFELKDLSVSVLSYIRVCFESVIVDKCTCIFPSEEPWMKRHICIWACDSAFRSGDSALYKDQAFNVVVPYPVTINDDSEFLFMAYLNMSNRGGVNC